MNPELLTIDQVIQAYMQHALMVQGDQMLNIDKKSQAMLQMAQALNYLVPLATNDSEAELEMKTREHQMNLQAKQQELEFKQQEHIMKLQQSQETHAAKLIQSQQAAKAKQQEKDTMESIDNK